MSDIIWSEDAWADYLYWQEQDRRTLRRINALVKDILRNGPASGIGKPEPLTGNLRGEYSRRIDEKNRLVYHIEDGRLYIVSCRTHYGDYYFGSYILPRSACLKRQLLCCRQSPMLRHRLPPPPCI